MQIVKVIKLLLIIIFLHCTVVAPQEETNEHSKIPFCNIETVNSKEYANIEIFNIRFKTEFEGLIFCVLFSQQLLNILAKSEKA
jgi:hypothetical protein